jgi:hypothetical protein
MTVAGGSIDRSKSRIVWPAVARGCSRISLKLSETGRS